MSRGPGNDSDERRLIDIAPVEVLTAGEVIKFVSKNSVTPGGEKVEKQFSGGKTEDNGWAEGGASPR